MSRMHTLSIEVVETARSDELPSLPLVMRSSLDFPLEAYCPAEPVASAAGSFLLRSRDGTAVQVLDRSDDDDN